MYAKHLEKHYLGICLFPQNFSPLSLQSSGCLPSKISSCENVYVLELQSLSISVGKEQDPGEQDTAQSSCRRSTRSYLDLWEGHCLLLWVGTWATTPNLTLCSRTEQLKLDQKKDLAHLGQLRGNLTFTQAEVRWQNFYSQGRNWGWKLPQPCNAGGNVWCSLPHSHLAFIKMFSDSLQQETGF